MNQITKEALDFVMEAKERFTQDEELTTYRNEEASYIALRGGFREDCMMIYELGNVVGNFVGQLPTQHKVLIDYDDISILKELQQKVTSLFNEYNDSDSEYGKGILDALNVVTKSLSKVKMINK